MFLEINTHGITCGFQINSFRWPSSPPCLLVIHIIWDDEPWARFSLLLNLHPNVSDSDRFIFHKATSCHFSTLRLQDSTCPDTQWEKCKHYAQGYQKHACCEICFFWSIRYSKPSGEYLKFMFTLQLELYLMWIQMQFQRVLTTPMIGDPCTVIFLDKFHNIVFLLGHPVFSGCLKASLHSPPSWNLTGRTNQIWYFDIKCIIWMQLWQVTPPLINTPHSNHSPS